MVFHDAITKSYVDRRISVAGAPFIGGSDDYAGLWSKHAGFKSGVVHDFSQAIKVDRGKRRLIVDQRAREATEARCKGKDLVLFVEAEKA